MRSLDRDMWIYGDLDHSVDVAEEAERLTQALRAGPGDTTGLLVDAGALAQGVLDLRFSASGRDEWGALQQLAHGCALSVARWWLGQGEAAQAAHALRQLAARAPGRVAVRLTEGFSHYALQPREWVKSAEGLTPRACVVGLRSIGVTLGAVVAAACGAPRFWTVRPVGPHADRRLSLSPLLARRLSRAAARADVALVDEGPGLTGSSFLSAVQWFERRGTPRPRIRLLPSHPHGPGAGATREAREAWTACNVRPAELVTPPAAVDLSAGRWRAHAFARPRDWPPVVAALERHKFLLGDVLWKFVGHGAVGRRKRALADALGEARWGPAPVGFREGYLGSAWRKDVQRGLEIFPRGEQVALLARYLAFRATLGVEPGAGADLPLLQQVSQYNAERLGLGPLPPCPAFERRPVATDGRLHPWEWLVLPGGEVRKTDAVDHHLGHDVVGAQDLAWDLAGACVEFNLSGAAGAELTSRVSRATGQRWSPGVLDFHVAAYCVFQCALLSLAGQSAGEAARCAAARRHYEGHLRAVQRRACG